MNSPDQSDLADLSMLDLFRIEAENYTKILEKGLVDVESSQSPEKIEPLMRAAHSIKGAARIVGLDLVVSLAHAMEDLLSSAQKGKVRLTSSHIDMLLQGNDVLSNLARMEVSAIPSWLDGERASIEHLSSALRAVETEEAVVSTPAKPPADSFPPIQETQAQSPDENRNQVQAKTVKGGEKQSDKTEETSVRVVSESLNRLMGLAGECLVEAKSTKPFSSSLLKVKELHMELASEMEYMSHYRGIRSIPREAREMFGASVQKLDRVRDLIDHHIEDFETFTRSLERLADQLYGEVLKIRMRPFSDGLFGFPRMVRDLAKGLGKKVSFEVIGDSTMVDRDILEKLEAPLTHIVRNAIDHGLETEEERIAASKPGEGVITLEARHSSGMLNITITDDGRGINIEKIRKKIVRDGRVAGEMASTLRDDELLDFLFLPGFTTTAGVTEISGRGVGLDVVLTMVEEVGGSVRVETKQGKGTSFRLHLPLTLSVVRGLLVDIGGEPYAIPLARIDRIVETGRENLRILEDKQFYTRENEHLGIVDAHQVLDVAPSGNGTQELSIAVISDRLNRYGLVVDKFLGEKELVVIPLDPRLGKVPNISAGAILENGAPALILDVDDLVRSIDNILTHGKLHKVGDRAAHAKHIRKRILVVDDSLTVREVERRLLEKSGYEVTVAVDGADGWNLLQAGRFELVVSDIDMPRMNGIDLIRKIRSDTRFRDLPVIIVSYKDREEDRLKGLEAGANYYLTKSSFHDEGLNRAVRDMIGEA